MLLLAHGNNLYSIADGQIITKAYDENGFGNYIIIKANDGKGFLYGHMREPSPLDIGDNVNIGDYVGHEGTTGNSTRYSFTFRNARFK